MKLIFVVYGWYETTMLNMKKMNEIKKKNTMLIQQLKT